MGGVNNVPTPFGDIPDEALKHLAFYPEYNACNP
jgi:hypothetical protein